MLEPGSFKNELRQTIRLAVPIMVAQVGQMLMSLTDTLVVGHVSVTALAAVAFSNTLLVTILVFGIGVLTSVAVVSSQAHGAGLQETKAIVLRSAVWLSIALGTILALLLMALNPFMSVFGQPPSVLDAARPYLILVGWSLVPVLGYMGVKMFCDSLGKPTIPMWILYAAVVLNLILNWILVFGKLGAPRLGLEGSAWATLGSRLLAMFGTLAYALHLIRGKLAWLRPFPVDKEVMTSLIRLGLPVGFQYLSEVAAFNFAAIMMGWLGTASLAAHQVAITCAATTFMFPLGVSQAVSVRIGHVLGDGRHGLIRKIGFGGIGISAMVMACFAVILALGGKWIAEGFSQDQNVIGIAISLLVIAGGFQLADGVQVTATGALRGIADVRVPMVLAYFFYWGVAIPIGYFLAFLAGLGSVGIWIGLAAGLVVAAIVNTARFAVLTRPGRIFQTVIPAVP